MGMEKSQVYLLRAVGVCYAACGAKLVSSDGHVMSFREALGDRRSIKPSSLLCRINPLALIRDSCAAIWGTGAIASDQLVHSQLVKVLFKSLKDNDRPQDRRSKHSMLSGERRKESNNVRTR